MLHKKITFSPRWLLLLILILGLGGAGYWHFVVNAVEVEAYPAAKTVMSGAAKVETVAFKSELPAGAIRFTEIAKEAGVNYHTAVHHPMTIRDSTGTGCAFLDFNNDGNLDILLIGNTIALYQGDGKGHFTDVTQAMGLSGVKGIFQGCCVGDYDNDGYDDIYISGYYTGFLLHNDKGRGFTDVTPTSGLKAQRWGSSCAFVDIDGDGYLDLVVANYLLFDPKTKAYCNIKGHNIACGPLEYQPVQLALFRNLKNGKFEEATQLWKGYNYGGSLGLACADYDGTGHPSLALANDQRFGDLMHFNAETESFSNYAAMMGVTGATNGRAHAGMGIDWGDYDNDGRLDLFITTFQGEARTLFHSDSEGGFKDMAEQTGLAAACKPYLAFGVKFVDVDNDGWLDLMVADGYVQDEDEIFDHAAKFHQTTQLLHNDFKTKPHFSDISAEAGLKDMRPIMGRGLAVGDFDNDGRMDALVADSDGTPQLLHNVSPSTGHWLLCKLEGTKSNRDGIGALLTFEVNGRKLLRQCSPGGSYLSSSDMRVHVGLGDATQTTITVKWPSGKTTVHRNIAADHIVTLRESDG